MLLPIKVIAHKLMIWIKKFTLISQLAKIFRINLGEKPIGCEEFWKWYSQFSSRDFNVVFINK